MDERELALGFLPQKELVYNKLLPYAEQLDSESQIYLSEIKTNLGKAILHHDLRDISFWASHLAKYIRLYGHKFSKKDHVNFIKVIFELMIVPDIELHFVLKASIVLNLLLKKIELLSRDDLILPWRPLYDLFERILFSPNDHLGIILLPGNMESSLKSTIRSCRPYFSVESTQELLDELRPLMCPFDETMAKALPLFELFLCTTLPPTEHNQGFKLWFDEFMNIWQVCHNSPIWENSFLKLFSRLARDNIGYIDWDPYIPMVFTKVLKNFNLPGRSSKILVNPLHSNFDITAAVTWIVAMLGAGSSCQVHINRLFKALESYYHPSNHGRWLIKLQRFLHKLPFSVVKRLHKEKHGSPSWLTPIPKEYRLSQEDITQFVKSVVPAALLSMFSKCGCADSAVALQNLAILRPELVIPAMLERLYSSLETLTEPHRLTAAMHCVFSVARTLVQKNKYFPEGPGHVIPLLMGALPGIDPNDIKKCMVTFQFISTFATLVLLVDCSKAVDSSNYLTEHQQELCIATAAFEDFVLQFMDRCFVLIENNCLDNLSCLDRDSQRTNPEENFLEIGLYSSFGTILTQSSPAIYQAALSKFQAFVCSHIFEIKISGKFAANMCRSASRANPELALQTFVPHFTKLVLALTESDEVSNEEKLDDELLFSLLLLSEVVRCDGHHLLKYLGDIVKVLKRTLHLKCRDGYRLASALLNHTLKAFTLIYPVNCGSVVDAWNRHGEDELHLYIEDWGKPGDLNNLGLKFHITSDEELEETQNLLEMFLVPELNRLRAWTVKEKSLSRDEVQCSLNIVLDCLLGAARSLPMWPGEHISLRESSVPTYCVSVSECGSRVVNVEGGKNVRQLICEVLRAVLDHTNKCCEDDTKSLFLIIKLYHNLIFNWGVVKEELDNRWKTFRMVKRALENKLTGKKQHIRGLLIDRVYLQDELRTTERNKSYFTEMHRLLMKDLLQLSISHYGEVRSRAQAVLQTCFTSFSSSYKVILPEILQLLQKDPTICHEEFKGVLYLILGMKQNSLLVVPNWDMMKQLWPLIASSKHSEKPSIIKLLDCISTSIQKYLQAIQIKLEIPKACIGRAKCLWDNNIPLPSSPILSEDSILKAAEALCCRNIMNERTYIELVESLTELIKNGNLHWRHYHLTLAMLLMLIRIDVSLPKATVEIFVGHLKHEALAVRKLAISATCAILQQQKRIHPKVEIDPVSQIVPNPDLHPSIKQLGVKDLPKNQWLQYNSCSLPNTEEAWNSRHFVHKTHVGFYTFPQNFKVYAPSSEQPKLDRKREELSEEEKPLFDAFSQQSFVESILSYFSLEERKGQDKFDAKRFYLFKGLFRNFGDTFLPFFLDHLIRMTRDKQESMQRCAAEVISGLLRGSKHWNFAMMQHLEEQLTPILRTAVNNITPETLMDWGTCIASASESRDPNRYYWLFELLMEELLKVESGSFLESSWLYMLLGVLTQQEWRVTELLHRILAYLEPKLSHSYQNVREKMGSVLSNIFMYDVPLAVDTLAFTPKRAPFLQSLLPKFAVLENTRCDLIQENSNGKENSCDGASSDEAEEKKNATNLFRTICRWLMVNVTRTLYCAPPEIFKFLPLLCQMQHDTTDEGLQRECIVTTAVLGQASLNPEAVEAALEILKNIISSNSWHSRTSAVSFLQIMVFSNLFTIIEKKSWTKDISDMVFKLLEDERVEVREAAAETLGGFLHCEFMKITDDLLITFKQKCRKKVKRLCLAQNSSKPIEPDELRERHAGVLGLCACVNAFPYDVPEFLPDILVLLGDHLHDPQPIETTIKKTLTSFRRTHHDNWRDHKLKFTDDQLAVITDLLVSPSYYA